MQTNATPLYDRSVNTTGCCAKFDPTGWDGETLHFRNKKFLRAHTMSAMHIPLNMGRVFTRVHKHIDAHGAKDPEHFIVMSRDLSPWTGEHLFAVTKDVPNEETVSISGDYLTKVFEGPFSEIGKWHDQFESFARAMGHTPGKVWFFYTTCPTCAKAYGRNYVIGLVEIEKEKAA